MLKSFAGGLVFGGTWGQGPASVLALHGWRRSHQDFSVVFEPGGVGDGDEVSAVAPDLFGFGATPPPPEPWGSEEYAAHLVPLFEEPGVLAERVILVGHSFGGRVSVPLYGLVPDRIDRVVLTGVPLLDRRGRRSKPAPAFRAARRLHRLGLLGDDRMEAMRNRYGSPDYRAAQGVMRGVFVKLLAEQYTPGMAAMECPVDLVWGEQDDQVPLEVAQRATGLFPSAHLTTLAGIGHLVPTEAPGQLRSAILGGSRRDPRNDAPTGPRNDAPTGSHNDAPSGSPSGSQ